MTTMKTKIFTLLTAVCMTVVLNAATYSGKCGDNLTWILTTTDSTLTISGTGAMLNYDYILMPLAPWYEHTKLIKSVTLEDGVTSIGDCAFYGCSKLKSVIIPNSVKGIGNDAFNDCTNLASITIPNSVTTIGKNAFADCSALTSLILPDSLTSISDGVFSV